MKKIIGVILLLAVAFIIIAGLSLSLGLVGALVYIATAAIFALMLLGGMHLLLED